MRIEMTYVVFLPLLFLCQACERKMSDDAGKSSPRKDMMETLPLKADGKSTAPGKSMKEEDAIKPLSIRGNDFVDPDGNIVRFWGMNTVSLFPTHAQAERIAEKLASMQINLVRPHHMMRPSRDWVVKSGNIALSEYKTNSRDPNPEAWDRFDYFNAALRRRGIYLAFSLHQSRDILQDDVSILYGDKQDSRQWRNAVRELNSWDWKRKIDPMKILPAIDERAMLLQKEFTRQLLGRVNPYTGIAYGQDPQVITLEVVNEANMEYIVVCHNKFPDYFLSRLLERWREFAGKRGFAAADLYAPNGQGQMRARADFLREIDRNYFVEMRDYVRSLGCKIPMMYSNLPYSEGNGKLSFDLADITETHIYTDPRVAMRKADFMRGTARVAMKGKPLLLGEFNMSEWGDDLQEQRKYRSMLPLAASTYTGLHGVSAVVWFSWNHGDVHIGEDGLAASESRGTELGIGNIMLDGVLMDHMRANGLIFRRGLARPSVSPVTIFVDDPLPAGDYHEMLREKYKVNDGWQNVHSVRRFFGDKPSGGGEEKWFTTEPETPLMSDTGEIAKDTKRKQLTFAVPEAEAFSGFIDGAEPRLLKHLQLEAQEGFATVIAVSHDKAPLGQSEHILISRTFMDTNMNESDNLRILLKGMKTVPGSRWVKIITRPSLGSESQEALKPDGKGALNLPVDGWYECELVLRPE